MQLDGDVTAVCWRGCHTLDLPRLRLQTPTLQDTLIGAAAASDPEAQRWFGWRRRSVVNERRRDLLLTRRAGRGRPVRRPVAGHMDLIAVDRTSGLVAGSVSVQINSGELGGWLAPSFRSRGLGGELFAGGAFFAHHILGTGVVRAGTETTNAACIGALRSAGFVPADGPEVHHLPDGRAIPSLWFRHDADRADRCSVAG
jgi:RimJ/RimL family protein N-acetyltransferase